MGVGGWGNLELGRGGGMSVHLGVGCGGGERAWWVSWWREEMGGTVAKGEGGGRRERDCCAWVRVRGGVDGLGGYLDGLDGRGKGIASTEPPFPRFPNSRVLFGYMFSLMSVRHFSKH